MLEMAAIKEDFDKQNGLSRQGWHLRTVFALLSALALSLGLSACAHDPSAPPDDPLQPVNRATFQFNQTADRYVVRPVAKGYVALTPNVVRKGVTNFFGNLFYPITIVNDLLQGKVAQTGKDTGRFIVNSTIGVAGFFDPASRWHMPQHNEDFGQTLGRWGMGPGWYVVLPVLGPSSTRDVLGQVVDVPLNPLYYVNSNALIWSLIAFNLINTRANLLSADRFLQNALDPYLFVRDAYYQRREYSVYDGNPPRSKSDDFDQSESPGKEPPPSRGQALPQ